MMSPTATDNDDGDHREVSSSSSPAAVTAVATSTENETATVTPAAAATTTTTTETETETATVTASVATFSATDNTKEELVSEDFFFAKQEDGRKVPRKRAPYGKRGTNTGVLQTTNGALDAVIGISPFGIFCKGCKTKIAFSTFKNHIRDAHPTCFTPSSVNYAAVSREYERLVEETKIDIILADSKAKTTNGVATTTEALTSTSSEELLSAYLDGTDVVDRFQCTSCYCLFDNKSNAKRHFLSMKTGCQEADLSVVPCRKTICYRAVTLTELEKMKRDSALAVVDNAYAKHQQLLEERNLAVAAAEEEVDEEAPSSKSKKRKISTKKKKAARKTSTKKDDQKKTTAKKKTTRKRPMAPAIESSDEEEKRPPPPSPPGERSSSRLRKRRRELAGASDHNNDGSGAGGDDGGAGNQGVVEGGIMSSNNIDESNNLGPIEI